MFSIFQQHCPWVTKFCQNKQKKNTGILQYRTIIEDMTIHNLKEEASNAAKANNCDRINVYILKKK